MIVLIALNRSLSEIYGEKKEVAVKPKTLGANITHVACKPQMCKGAKVCGAMVVLR